MKITFVYHTCYCVEDDGRTIIFDYWKGKLPLFNRQNPVYVFVSHHHQDHFNPEIYQLNEQYEHVYYIFSDDIRPFIPGIFNEEKYNVIWMKAGQCRKVGELLVSALFSTDEGVAYLIKTEDITLMHFGDLNWWYWEGEEESFNLWQKKHYCEEIKKLGKEHIDISFGPALDARQKPYHWLGMDYFLRNVHVDYVFPIHFFDEIGTVKEFILSDRAKEYRHKLMCVEKNNQEFKL